MNDILDINKFIVAPKKKEKILGYFHSLKTKVHFQNELKTAI